MVGSRGGKSELTESGGPAVHRRGAEIGGLGSFVCENEEREREVGNVVIRGNGKKKRGKIVYN